MKSKRNLLWVVPVLILIVFISCKKKANEEVSVPFNPVISMNTNLSSSEPIATYTTEYQALFAMGARGAQTVSPWSTLNSTGSTYDLTQITNGFFGLNALQGYGFNSILLTVPIIAITQRRLPADIAASNLNDPAVKAAFRALIDQIVPYLNASVKYISLGNEVDSYFSTHPTEWVQYKELIEDARTYIKSLKPNILVGVTTTFDGASSTHPTEVASLNENMDVIIMTYYPISAGFVARSPSVVAADMQAMVTLANSKPIVMQEWGYPSSTVNSGSEQLQADFIANSIVEWKKHGTDKIPFISFFKRRDWDAAHCAAITSQIAGQTFYEFMCSLGVYQNNGTAKASYQILLNNLNL